MHLKIQSQQVNYWENKFIIAETQKLDVDNKALEYISYSFERKRGFFLAVTKLGSSGCENKFTCSPN